MSQKKMVSRNVAIGLGIICIILVAGLAVVLFMSYSPTIGSSITSLQSQLNDLNATYNSYMNTHSHSDSDFNSLSNQNTNLQNQNNQLNSQITDLQSILNLQKQEAVVSQYSVNQGSGQSSAIVSRSFLYSGYLDISATSTTSNAYINLQYWFGGKLYSSSQTVGTSGDVIFAILKTDSATVYVGNTNFLNGATETITITYHY